MIGEKRYSMSNLGTLTINLVAKTGSFVGPLDKAGRQAKKTSKDVSDSFSDSLKSVTKWGFGLGVVATGTVVAFAKKSIEAASAINDVAKAAGMSTDTLQEMRHAASLSGISFDELDGSLLKFNKSVGEARAGSGSLYSYLKKVDQGLLDQVRSANSTDDALNLIFKSMKNVSNESERAALAAAAFGRSGVKLSVLADDYETLRKEAQSLGIVIDSQLIKNADEAGDKLETLSRVIGAQLTTAVLNFAPTIQKVAEQILKLSESTAKFFGGGHVSEIDIEIAALEELRYEFKQTEETFTAMQAQKGYLLPGELDQLVQAKNNVETLTESINQLNVAKNGGPSKPSTPPLSLEKPQDTSWDDLKKIIEATSETNKQRLEIIKSSNLAIRAENDRQLQADIAKDAEYRQLVDQANLAELNNITDNVERELALHEYKYEKLKQLYEEGSAELTEIERAQAAERAAIVANSDYWSGYSESLESSIVSMDEIVGGSLDDLTSKFGNFLSDVIIGNEEAGEAFKKLATEMASSMLSAIGKMIAQWIVYEVTKTAVDKSVQAAAIPSLIANAQAGALLAGINAYASAAAIPYTGWVLAPGAMAAALAATEPMAAAVSGLALAGLAHDGIDSIPETGTWLLKKGERVVAGETSKKLDNTLSRINYGIGSTSSSNGSIIGGQRGYSEPHFHQHFDGPVFLNRSHIKDVTRMFMDEFERERTRVGAVR
ncbi:MAG TPA: hypothetical protein VJ327_10930 [Patescibacteria group bacterium]|nr:hypothetical protein [Patescibacteria group bacterium]